MPSRALRFAGKTALVTGGASGIGRAIVEGLLEEGARVVLFDIDPAATDVTAADLAGRGDLTPVVGSIAERADVRRAVAECVRSSDRLDVLMANAGIGAVVPFLDIDQAGWDRVLAVNLTGTFHAVQEAAAVMARDGQGGSIVVTSSQNAFFPQYSTAAYSATKGALATLVRAAALDLSGQQIRLNAISPGYIDTPLAAPLVSDQKTAAGLLAHVPLGRFGRPGEVASAALFLASAEASYITGANIVVDGGTTLGMSLGAEGVVLPGFDKA
jgi:NAD(P)-dependent dehydrogenase (short-subunit alcohol dehydrogenase family)